VREKTGKGYVECAAAVVADSGARVAAIEAAAPRGGVTLPAGASAAKIAEVEQRIGVARPAAVKALYAAHDGGGPERILGQRRLLSLDGVAAVWSQLKGFLDEGIYGTKRTRPTTACRRCSGVDPVYRQRLRRLPRPRSRTR
jgi:cell wall assembly regulator SMI1